MPRPRKAGSPQSSLLPGLHEWATFPPVREQEFVKSVGYTMHPDQVLEVVPMHHRRICETQMPVAICRKRNLWIHMRQATRIDELLAQGPIRLASAGTEGCVRQCDDAVAVGADHIA